VWGGGEVGRPNMGVVVKLGVVCGGEVDGCDECGVVWW